MSEEVFLDRLKQVGYPRAASLDPTSLEWLFEKEAVLPFLEWFCDNIHESNVVQSKELEEFAELEKSTEGILEGAQLEEALQNLSASEDLDYSLDRLRREVEQLELEVKSCNSRRENLTQNRNKLGVHQLSVNERVSKLDPVAAKVKQNYRHHLEHAQEDNNKMNNSVVGLSEAVSELMTLYTNLTSGQSAGDVAFLSQVDLKPYHAMEERFGAQLASFTRKQFFEGIADIASEGDATRYEFLEISKPVNLLVRGERQEVNLDECRELARLQTIYPKSECDWINALVQLRRTQAACQFAEDKAKHLRQRPYPATVNELSSCLQDAETSLAIVSRDLDTLGRKEIPSLIKESAALQVTQILRGNYDLKIARQDYFTSNQDQLITQLLLQQGRHDMLTMGYEIEMRMHRDTHKLLTAVTLLMEQTQKEWTDRMGMMTDSQQGPARHQRGTVDSRDKFITRLYHSLDNPEHSDSKQLFLTYAGLQEQSSRLQHQLTSLRAAVSSTNSHQDDKLAVLESNLQSCESMVYQGSSTTAGPPLLCPQPVIDSLTQLDLMLKKVEQAVTDVMKGVEGKKKILKTDLLQSTERNLFVYFFNDPARLRRALSDVQNRLQAALAK